MMIRRSDYDHLIEGVLHKSYECPLCQKFKETTTPNAEELKKFLLEEGEKNE
jgi:hypothetical protein